MKKQSLINQQLRVAVRSGKIPHTFEALDSKESHYRKIICELQKELNIKLTAKKEGAQWTINLR